MLTLFTWWFTSALPGLPEAMPSHWGPDGADGFMEPGAVRSAWLFGAVLAVAAATSVSIGALHGGWGSVGRGATAACVGAVGAVLSGLLAQLLLARGRSSVQLVELGAAPSIIGVFAGFAVLVGLALALLPKAADPDR